MDFQLHRVAPTILLFLSLPSASLATPNRGGGEVTVGALAIRIAVENDPTAKVWRIRRQAKALAREARQFLVAAESDNDRLDRFNHFFFDRAGFRPEEPRDDDPALLLHHVLERRLGNCVGLVQAYLYLTEQLGLPVVAAAAPTHLFVRWRVDGGGINVELLEGGRQYSNAEYRERYRISEPNADAPVFLRDLAAQEVGARILNNIGVAHSRGGRLELAAREYDRAAKLDPRFAAPRYNRALDYLGTGRLAEAAIDLEAALELYPADAWALNNLGLARLRMGNRDLAMDCFRRALALDPELEVAKTNLELAEKSVPGGKDPASGGAATEPRP